MLILNFLKINNPLLAAINVNISNIPLEWTNWEYITRNEKNVKSDVEQFESDGETQQIFNFDTMDINFFDDNCSSKMIFADHHGSPKKSDTDGVSKEADIPLNNGHSPSSETKWCESTELDNSLTWQAAGTLKILITLEL